jgi:transglutaminase-like putative cysteine protease
MVHAHGAYAWLEGIPTGMLRRACHKQQWDETRLISRGGLRLKIRFGYELVYSCPQPVPMILMLHVHSSRAADLLRADQMTIQPHLEPDTYVDLFGNACTRIVAPAGETRFRADGLIQDSGLPEAVFAEAQEHPVEELPHDTLGYLLGSRYCETQQLMNDAWRLFGHVAPGWSRVQAVCDFAHQHIEFGYQFACPTKTAWEVYCERQGVCRDYAHLAIALLRCLNIPARYCTGYLGDIGVPVPDAPMDFSGWLEAYIGGAWHPFDPRNNQRRIGRVLIARGRDAADVAISTAFGPNFLQVFKVWTDEVATTSLWIGQSL